MGRALSTVEERKTGAASDSVEAQSPGIRGKKPRTLVLGSMSQWQPLALELLGGTEYHGGQSVELHHMVPYPSGYGSSLLNCQVGENRRMRSNRIGTANLYLWRNGTRSSLRGWCRKACGFESRQIHQDP